MTVRTTALGALLAFAFAWHGCKENAAQSKKEKDSAADTDTSTDVDPAASPSPVSGNPCGTATQTATSILGATSTSTGVTPILLSDEDEGGESLDDEEAFGLVGTVSYEGQIKLIVQSRCGSCHFGNSNPNLSNYNLVVAAASQSLSEMEAGSMPRNGTMPPAEIQAWRDWIAAGVPQVDPALGATGILSGTATNVGTSGTGIFPCTTSTFTATATGTGDDLADAWQQFLNPPELAQCHTQGKLFDRQRKICHTANMGTWPCTRDGAIAKFQSIGLNATADLDGLLASGWILDQCGESSPTDPVTMLYKQSAQGSTLNLDVKRLCKPGSMLCQ